MRHGFAGVAAGSIDVDRGGSETVVVGVLRVAERCFPLLAYLEPLHVKFIYPLEGQPHLPGEARQRAGDALHTALAEGPLPQVAVEEPPVDHAAETSTFFPVKLIFSRNRVFASIVSLLEAVGQLGARLGPGLQQVPLHHLLVVRRDAQGDGLTHALDETPALQLPEHPGHVAVQDAADVNSIST